jgi:hypothetical protein
MKTYWLGVLTPFAVVAVVFIALVAWVRILWALERQGFTFNLRAKRDLERISDFILRHNIWWERSWGPIFAGGWYREVSVYDAPDQRHINRWVGLGRPNGPCWMAIRTRKLQPTAPPVTRPNVVDPTPEEGK